MQIQKVLIDNYSKAIMSFNKEGRNITGVTIHFSESTPEFQMKIGKYVDEFIKSEKVGNVGTK